MERKLPTYEIAGIPFIVDVEYNLLRHPEQQEIGYRFFQDMEDMDGRYRLKVDSKTLIPLTLSPAAEEILTVYVPYMVELDPEGVALKFSCPVSELPRSDLLLENNEELMYRRKIGKPAAMMILGEQFFVDTANGYMVAPGVGAQDWLNINTMPLDPFGVSYRCLYDPAKKKEFTTAVDGVVPEGIIALEIPHIRFSDSYNYRRLFGSWIEPTEHEWFLRYPVRSNMEARVIPLEKMGYKRKAEGQAKGEELAEKKREQEKPGQRTEGAKIAPKAKGKSKGQGGIH